MSFKQIFGIFFVYLYRKLKNETMKKMILAIAVVGGMAALTSCKKDWTCECTGEALGIPFTVNDTVYTDMTKKDAEAKCDMNDFSLGADNYAECSLK
jgi:hypothetical protein